MRDVHHLGIPPYVLRVLHLGYTSVRPESVTPRVYLSVGKTVPPRVYLSVCKTVPPWVYLRVCERCNTLGIPPCVRDTTMHRVPLFFPLHCWAGSLLFPFHCWAGSILFPFHCWTGKESPEKGRGNPLQRAPLHKGGGTALPSLIPVSLLVAS